MPDGQYRLFCKGADSVIEERLANSDNNRKVLGKT
jgi:magnesium-transporting ATPase (P-type)